MLFVEESKALCCEMEMSSKSDVEKEFESAYRCKYDTIYMMFAIDVSVFVRTLPLLPKRFLVFHKYVYYRPGSIIVGYLFVL